MTNKNTKENINWLFQGLILTIIPAFAYLLAFTYELGYATFFNIPIELISLSTTLFCLSFIGLGAMSVVSFYLFNTIFKMIHRFTYKHPKIDRIATNWSVWVVVTVIILFLLAEPSFIEVYLIVFLLLIILAIIDFLVVPLFRKINEKLNEANQEYVTSLLSEGPLVQFEQFLEIKMKTILSSIVILFLCTFFMGISEGSQKQMFMVSDGKTQKIVLRIYGGNMILSDFDYNTNEISSSFTIQPVGQSEEIFTWKNVGKVKPLGGIYNND